MRDYGLLAFFTTPMYQPDPEQAKKMERHVDEAAHRMGSQMFGAFALPWPRKPIGKGKGGTKGKSAPQSAKSPSRSPRNSRSKRGPFPGW